MAEHTVDVKILTEATVRSRDTVESYIIDQKGQIFELICSNSNLKKKIEPGKFVKLYNVNIMDGNKIGLRTTSKIFPLPKKLQFKVDSGKEYDFFNPQTLSVAEALASPPPRQLHLNGCISNVSEIVEGAGWQRRNLVIRDVITNQRITLKLWGKFAPIPALIGQTICLKNIKLELYKKDKALVSTPRTEIKIQDTTSAVLTEIKTMDKTDKGTVDFLTTERLYQDIAESILPSVYEKFQEALPVFVILHSRNGKLIKIEKDIPEEFLLDDVDITDDAKN